MLNDIQSFDFNLWLQSGGSGVENTAGGAGSDSFISVLQSKFEITAVLSSAPEMENVSEEANAGTCNTGFFVSQHQVNRALKQNYLYFTAMLDEELEERGISKYLEFEVSAGSDGSLYINGEREDRAEIEEILNTTPGLKEAFKQMSANASQAVVMERIQAFSLAYAVDPEFAYQQQNYLREDEVGGGFSLKVTEKNYVPEISSYGRKVFLTVFAEIVDGDFADLLGRNISLVTVSSENVGK